MAQVVVHVGGHDYRLACRDGEESRLEKLGQYLDRKAEDLQQSLGQVTETRLLLMAAILVVDELLELRERQVEKEDEEADSVLAAPAPSPEPEDIGVNPDQVDQLLSDTLEKITEMTQTLSQAAA
ncbi:MAG: cell division protein ZapA [Pseudomonadota bacterium]